MHEKFLFIALILLLGVCFFLGLAFTALWLWAPTIGLEDAEAIIGKERLLIVRALGYSILLFLIGCCCLCCCNCCFAVCWSGIEEKKQPTNKEDQLQLFDIENELALVPELTYSHDNLLELVLYGSGLFEALDNLFNIETPSTLRSQIVSYLNYLDDLQLESSNDENSWLKHYLQQGNGVKFYYLQSASVHNTNLRGPILFYDQGENALSHYCQLMENDKAWGSQVELLAFLLQQQMTLVLHVSQWGDPTQVYCVLPENDWEKQGVLVLNYQGGRYSSDKDLYHAINHYAEAAKGCESIFRKTLKEKFGETTPIHFMKLQGRSLLPIELTEKEVIKKEDMTSLTASSVSLFFTSPSVNDTVNDAVIEPVKTVCQRKEKTTVPFFSSPIGEATEMMMRAQQYLAKGDKKMGKNAIKAAAENYEQGMRLLTSIVSNQMTDEMKRLLATLKGRLNGSNQLLTSKTQ